MKCHTLNISLTFSPAHCKTALSLPQSAISLCAGRVRVQESGHKGVGHTNTHTDTDAHTHIYTHHPLRLPNLTGSRRERGCGRRGVVRPFDPQLHFIYECECANFFLQNISLYIEIYIFFSVSSCIFPRELLGQTCIARKWGGGRGRLTDGQRDGQFV